jgi:hypothetical protein
MTEKLSRHERRRQCGAVHTAEGHACALRILMNCLSDQFLTCACFPGNEHSRVRGCHLLHFVERALECGRSADDLLEFHSLYVGKFSLQCLIDLLQGDIVSAQFLLQNPVLFEQYLIVVERFLKCPAVFMQFRDVLCDSRQQRRFFGLLVIDHKGGPERRK